MHRQLTLLAALLLPGALSAQRTGTFLEPLPDEGTTRVAQRGANFLEIGVGARARAMGEAYTGLASGATAAFWNPAGLGSTESFTAAFTHQALYDDLGIDHNFAAVILPFMGGGIGVSYIRLNSGDMPRTDESNPGGGSLTGGEFFSFTSQAIGLHYGRRITDRLQVGFTGRYITEGITQASVTWWGLDVGTMFNTGLYGIRLGAALANAGPSARYEGGLIQTRAGGGNQDATFPFGLPVRFKTVAYTIPTTFRFAVVSDVMGGADALFAPGGKHDLVIATELNDAVDTDVQLSVGGEYSYNQIVFLRAGKKFVNEARSDFRSFGHALSFGGGFRLPVLGSWLTMDYAYTNMGELQNVHAFSFELGRSR
jgi:hypothetical protein